MKRDPKSYPDPTVERVRQEVLHEFTRIEGEDFEEWNEFITYEINERLREIREKEPSLFCQQNVRYD